MRLAAPVRAQRGLAPSPSPSPCQGKMTHSVHVAPDVLVPSVLAPSVLAPVLLPGPDSGAHSPSGLIEPCPSLVLCASALGHTCVKSPQYILKELVSRKNHSSF